MGAVLSILSVAAVFLRLLYVWRFAYKSRLSQPIKYAQIKQFLNRAITGLVLVSASYLVIDGSWVWALALAVGSAIVTHLVQGAAYSRAVFELSEWRDPNTGEYVFSGTQKDRDKMAVITIDADRI